MTAIVVLGMHRSGTSCLAGMLAAGGLASTGEAVRNWDNARGHHEMLDVVRLDEAVLAHSGGHWLSAPADVRWTDEHAAARDRLLAARIDGRPALLKDPRTLLVLPFWRASTVPFHVIAIVRHPLAVARSLEGWRGVPLAEGVALWTAHNRMLEADRAVHGYPLVDFEQPRAAVIAATLAACGAFGTVDAAALADAYEEQLVHHDDAGAPDVPGLAEADALYRRLAGATTAATRRAYPRDALEQFGRALRRRDLAAAVASARAALSAIADASAVLVPVVTALVRYGAFAEARELVAGCAGRLDEGLAALLHGKVLLAMREHAAAAEHLAAACAVARPYFQARHLLPQALRGAGRHTEAYAALREVAAAALYPHNALATLAEWRMLDGDPDAAHATMREAISAAPPHRRGRLRTRLAEWLLARDLRGEARAELELAVVEDPGYPRSREVLSSL